MTCTQGLWDNHLVLSSMCQPAWAYGAFCIGRMARQLSNRKKNQDGSETIPGAILLYLVDTGHRFDPKQAFRTIYQAHENKVGIVVIL